MVIILCCVMKMFSMVSGKNSGKYRAKKLSEKDAVLREGDVVCNLNRKCESRIRYFTKTRCGTATGDDTQRMV